MSYTRRKPSAYSAVVSEVRVGDTLHVTHSDGYKYQVNLGTDGAAVAACNNFAAGDKVTILGIGIGIVREAVKDCGYDLWIVNQNRGGFGWEDKDLRPGWGPTPACLAK